jgi:DNA polymerase-3 subunit delta'
VVSPLVGPDGTLPLPWLAAPLHDALHHRRGHALLVHGVPGVGQFELSMCLAQAWLCDAPLAGQACGRCASCKLVQAHSHPDLMVLLPEALREELGWTGGDEGEGSSDKASKAKPSKDIKVDAVRGAVAFAQTTAGRGKGKVLVLHPAERMNGISANTLLKTLEEPPGNARFVLSCAAPEALLPTIRSRCQALHMGLPDPAEALHWLQGQGVTQPEVLLTATGGQVLDVLQWRALGIDARLWQGLPGQLLRGDVTGLAALPLPWVVQSLQKLCHDALCASVGAAPRYFAASAVPTGLALPALNAWGRALAKSARQAEHPWNAGLMCEALVLQAREVLNGRHTG